MIYSLIALVLFLGLFYLYLQSKMFTVFHVNVQSKKIQGELRLIQITDYHGNPWIDLEKLKTSILAFKPDILLFTGDMQDNFDVPLERSLRLFRTLRELNLPMVAVLGNHEQGEGKGQYEEALKALGVKLLKNECYQGELRGNLFTIIGMDHPFHASLYTPLMRQSTGYTLVLCHASKLIREAVTGEEDLILTGHTHGGQGRIPGIGAVYAPGEGFFPKYDKGLYHIGEKRVPLYVNSGLGNTFLPLRAFNAVAYAQIRIRGEEK